MGADVVVPEERGKGYAKRALELLIEHACRCGILKLRSEAVAGNAAAEGIYEELGFVETAQDETRGRTSGILR